jgi:hypothetical protein
MRNPKNASLMETDEARAALKLPPLPGSTNKKSSGEGDSESSEKAKPKAKTKAKITRKKRK